MNKPKEKTYPNTELQGILTKNGFDCRTLWEMKGPPNTAIAWLSCYVVNGCTVMVQTYTDNNGWQAYTHNASDKVKDTVEDVVSRCGLKFPETV